MIKVFTLSLLQLTLLLALLSTANSFAQESEDLELLALMTLLDEETELATQNKMNADFVPGTLSVLHGDQLQGYGVATVAEALNQVAGFYTTNNNAGNTVTVVRGIGVGLSSSNLKILLNGVATNRPVDASADSILRMPISQIERIEIIRGPGSALYGEFAFSGVINIITRQENSASVTVGSNHQRQADLLFDKQFSNGVQASLNLSSWKRDDSGLRTHPDNFARSGNGYSPGQVYDNEQGKLAVANLSYDDYRLQLQHIQIERGGWYGRFAAMPADLDPRVETITGMDLSKDWSLNPDLTLGVSLSSLQTELDEAVYLPIPKGTDPPGPRPPVAIDLYRQDGSSDSTQRASVTLHWSAVAHHNFYTALSYVDAKVTSSYVRRFELGQPSSYGAPDERYVLDGSKRALSSLTLQDQWQILPDLELTLGARYDHYDDWGSNISPRFAAVWRLSDRHILKAQYADAFRPPTMMERYPGINAYPANAVFTPLKEEHLSTSELAYIFHAAGLKLRTTLFHTQVRDLIEFYVQPGQPPVWRNRGDISSNGAEVELQHDINRDWNWFANLSYVDAEDHLDSDEKLLGTVDWLANLGINWHSSNRLTHSLALHYVGEQEGWELQTIVQPPARFSSYTLADYTLTLNDFLAVRDLKLSGGIKNLTDQGYDTAPTPAQYPLGLPHGERTGWMQVNYAF